jgi:exopolyphosphatase/guanosine-5'-triphosphate,3'-diphosphate pyrophosphatase
MPRFAVIDVGTNSVKCHVSDRQPDRTWRPVADRSEVTRLGEGLRGDGGLLAPAAMDRTAAAIVDLVADARRLGVDAVAAVGTMGLRTAANGADFVARIRRECGITIDVVSGLEESRLAYLAVQSGLGLPDGSVVVFDTGGGSSQFTFGRGTAILDRFSLNLGAVRLTETWDLAGVVSTDQLARARSAVEAELARLDGSPAPEAVVGVGGAVTNLVAVRLGLTRYDPEAIQGAILTDAEVDRQIGLYRTRTAEERRRVPGLQPSRAEVILAGALVVQGVLARLRRPSLVVSDRGVRHGLLVDRFG